MVLAARTSASPAGIWAIVIVAVVVLAFWLVSIYLADRSQVRASGRSRAAVWPAYAGGDARVEPVPQPEAPTRADIPAQPAAGAARPAMPAQRTGDADRPEHSHTGPGHPGQGAQEDEGQGR